MKVRLLNQMASRGAWLLPAVLSSGCSMAAPVESRTFTYRGWGGSIELTAGDHRLIVVPELGGRILHYSFEGGDILFENKGNDGKRYSRIKNWFPAGGYQLDIGPELGNPPGHNELWLGEEKVSQAGPGRLRLTSPDSPGAGVRLEKDIMLRPDGVLEVNQRMTNVSGKAVSYCLWDRTLTKSGGILVARVNPKSRYRAGWSLFDGKRKQYLGDSPSLPNADVIDGMLVVSSPPEKGWVKIGLDSDGGWVAYVWKGLLFVKTFPYSAKGPYTDGGNSLEVFMNKDVTELEPLSPEVKLAPGESYEFPETWILTPLDREVSTRAQAAGLRGRIEELVRRESGK